MPEETDEPDASVDECDVAIVGGGPAGCSAAVFTAGCGLDTVAFDRGAGSLDRCAFLANYLGFPAGIDVGTFQQLAHEHVRETGGRLVADLVEAVERDGDRFVVETQDGRAVTAEQVLAATRYDGEYLRPLAGDEAFETHEHDGEEHEHFDPDWADEDGRTPVEDLYVASPAGQRDVQAIVAAGRGAHVARTLIEDRRADRGYPEKLAKHYDWLRPDSEFEGEWGGRDRWREWFDERVPDDTEADEQRLAELREAYIDSAFATRRSDEEIADLTERGQRRLAGALDPEFVVAALDPEAVTTVFETETLVDAMDVEDVVAALDSEDLKRVPVEDSDVPDA